MTDEQLKRYIGAVDKVRETRAESPDATMRAKIAEELGMSPEDLAAAVAAGEAALARGEGFVARSIWDDAVTSLHEADALLPDDVRVPYALARALWGRYRERRNNADRTRALVECRRSLQLDAHHQGAFALRADIEAADREARRRRRQVFIAIPAAVAITVGGIFAFTVVPKRPACPDGGKYCTITAPLVAGDLGDDIALAPMTMNISPRGVHLNLAGRITHRGNTELGEFRLDAQYLDGSGKELGHKTIEAHPAYATPLRPGDSHTFYLSEDVPINTRSARLVAGERHTEPAPASYGKNEPLIVTFDPPVADHIQISAAYRSRTEHHYGQKTAVDGIVVIQNSGQGVIRSLDVDLQGIGPDGQSVGASTKQTVAYAMMPPMLPGERRLIKTLIYVTGNVVLERLIVSKVE